MLYYLDLAMSRRENDIDTIDSQITTAGYESENWARAKHPLSPLTDRILANSLASRIVMIEPSSTTARLTLFSDSQELSFSGFFVSIINCTTLSVRSDIATDITVTLADVE